MRISASSVVLVGCLASNTLAFRPYIPETDTDPSHWRPIEIEEDSTEATTTATIKSRIVARSPEPFNPTTTEDFVKPDDVWIPVSQYIETLEEGMKEAAAKEADEKTEGLKVLSFPLEKHEKREVYESDPAAWVSAEADRLSAKYNLPIGQHQAKGSSANAWTEIKKREATIESPSIDQTDIEYARKPPAKGSAALHNDGRDMAYLVKAELGSHRQEFMMVVDTGSSDTWVYNKDCDSKACLAHERYDHAKSTDYKRNGNSFNVTYGTGDSYGTFVTDRIKIGDFDLVTKFGLINEVSDIFAHFPLDGILALGFDFVSMSGEPGFLDELKKKNLIERRTFGMALSKTNDSLHDGVINFGGYDPTYFEGDLQFRNVSNRDQSAYWQVPIEDIKVGDRIINKRGAHGILDSGTSLIMAPAWDASHIHAGIAGALTNGNSFQVPCTTQENIELKLNGLYIKLEPKDWIGGHVAGSKNGCISLISKHKVDHEAYIGSTTWILGDSFMKQIYAYFDADNYRVGIAPKKSKAELIKAWESAGDARRTLVATDKAGSISTLAVNGNGEVSGSSARLIASTLATLLVAATSVALMNLF